MSEKLNCTTGDFVQQGFFAAVFIVSLILLIIYAEYSAWKIFGIIILAIPTVILIITTLGALSCID